MSEQSTAAQARRAEVFAGLQLPGDPLLLANVWDATSAVAAVSAGAPAIATTSAGVAWSFGVRDGADLGADRVAATVERITAAVSVPVSADIEAGYGESPDAVAATMSAVVRAGAVGVNIEDRLGRSLCEPAEQAERLAAARAAADRLGVPVWINARTDVFLVPGGSAEERLESALERAAAYAAAGADSLFVPGLIDLDAIAELAAGPLPVAVMVWAGAPSVKELAAAGAARVSLGSAVAEAAYAVVARATTELLEHGTYDSVSGGLSYVELNRSLSGEAQR